MCPTQAGNVPRRLAFKATRVTPAARPGVISTVRSLIMSMSIDTTLSKMSGIGNSLTQSLAALTSLSNSLSDYNKK